MVISSKLDLAENMECTGTGEQFSCEVDFWVQPSTKVFRSARTVEKPHTKGPQTATVTGPKGQVIWTNSSGMVRCQFHWDRYGKHNEHSSCWIRVVSPAASSGHGNITIPRINNEVLVDFLNGDPDQPIVIGCVYNASQTSPWPLPDSATQSGMMSRTIGGGASNFNAVRFEDKAGSEELMVQAEKDMNTTIKNNETRTIKASRTTHIFKDETTTIDGKRTETVTGDHQEVIHGTYSNTIDGKTTITTTGAGKGAPGDIEITSKTGSITLKATTKIEFVVGSSTITMLPTGEILISGPKHVGINDSVQ